MNKGIITLLAIVAFALATLFLSAYTVKETEQVVIVRFGKVIGDAVTKPGLHFKMPLIDKARRFEKRWLEWDGDANQVTTADKRYIYIDVFARWRISAPLQFIEILRDENSAQGRLDDIIDNATRNVIANHKLIELIRSSNREFDETDEESALMGKAKPLDEPEVEIALQAAPDAPVKKEAGEANEAVDGGLTETVVADAVVDVDSSTDADATADVDSDTEVQLASKGENSHAVTDRRLSETNRSSSALNHTQNLYAIGVGREKLTQLILEKASAKAAQLGIELKDVQFKRIDYIESVQEKVFDRMISERRRIAEAFRSQGQGRSAEIVGRMEKVLKEIQSDAYKSAEEIKGRADGEAARIYADAYNTNPDLYTFLKTLETYRSTIDENSWLILTTDADYAKLLNKMN